MHISRPTLMGLAVAAYLLCLSPAMAEFRAVQTPAAVLYDGPSKQAKKLYVAPRGMPVEVLSILPAWIKIRDQGGDVMWVERTDLGPVKSLLTTTTANVHQAPLDSSVLLFQVERGVLVEILETPAASSTGWVRIKLADGSSGFMKISEVYGL